MKAPEFYIAELGLMLDCIKCSSDVISEGVLRDLKVAKRQMLFRPWAKRHIAMAAAIRAEAGMQLIRSMKELQDKILESTGQDEDMRPITLKQMLKINDE
jgi:hypothetical protein